MSAKKMAKVDCEEWTPDMAAPSADEQAEYAKFLAEEADRAAADEAARLAEARAELEASEHASAYKSALAVINDAIDRANAYNSMMSALAQKHLASLSLDKVPEPFTGGTLRDYQREGFKWLVYKFLLNESGIIADEMGLGKTVQVISFIAWMMEQHSYHPILIICPLTVVGNWIAEFHRFAPSIKTLRYTGPRDARETLQEDAANFPKGAFGAAPLKSAMPVIITSYQFAMADADFLSRVQWRVLVLDEGHRIKNEGCAFRRILNTYCPSARSGGLMTKILLTGTPVQNDLTELWSLCNFVMPQVFRSKDEFMKIYRFIERGGDVNREYYVKGEGRRGIVTKLHSLLSRYMLRRTKAEVHLSLPPKVEVLVYTPLSTEQMQLLKALHKDTLVDAVRKLHWAPAEKADDPDWEAGVAMSINTNNKQMQTRKLCVHPFWIAEPRLPPGMSCDERIVTACGKLMVLDKMLIALRAQGHKVLIFSQFKTVLDILQDYFIWRNSDEGLEWAQRQYGDILFGDGKELKHTVPGQSEPPSLPRIAPGSVKLGDYRILHGSISAEERDKSIAEFNDDPDNDIFAFLLSTKAGGQGINLVAADTVIFYDSDWNPTSDMQAMDRAHRIGQTRPVVIYRLVTEGASIERRIVRTAASKGSLSRMVLQEGRHKFAEEGPSTPVSRSTPVKGRKGHASAAASASADTDGVDGVEKEAASTGFGRISDALLRYWLRDDVSDDMLIRGGIPDAELAIILDRARALQAGKRVTDDVEKELVASARSPPAGSPSTPMAATSAVSTPEGQHTSVGTPASCTGATRGELRVSTASGNKRRRSTTGAPDSTAKLPPAAHTSSTHLAIAPSASVPRVVLEHAEEEQMYWEAFASAAPFTLSKGKGYEFVYHTTTGSLLPSSGSGSSADTVVDSPTAAVETPVAVKASDATASPSPAASTGSGTGSAKRLRRTFGSK